MSTDAVAQAAAEATRPTEVTEGALFGIENPLLDISARVKPELLAKYKLKANDAILAGDEHATLYDELLADYPVEYIAGGAAQNSMRGATWLLPPKSTVYVGCVGQDAQADQLKATAVRDGLRTEYMVDPTTPTGKCAVLITNNDRSMVTALGAANNYNEAHIQQPEIWKLVEQAKVYYIGGFFMTVSPATIGLIARHAVDHGKQLAINLSAPFITQFFRPVLDEYLPMATVIFGNEAEAAAYAQTHELPDSSPAAAARHLANLPHPKGVSRTVVITQGSEGTLVATTGSEEVRTYAITPIAASEIVDTNGAGDAFAGGFLAGLTRGEPVDRCVAAGHYVASVVIRRSGPSYPATAPEFTF